MASVARIPESASVISPVSLRERIDVVDILRGWAIFGMLIINFSHDLGWGWWFATRWPDTADRVAYFLLHFFAAVKFHSLFSFLFGWGFALQMERAEARGVRFFPFYARRLFVLLLIGLANWILLDWDATLVAYALSGYLLFLFRRRSLKTVLLAALLCLCYWPAHGAVTVYRHAQRMNNPSSAEATTRKDADMRVEGIAREEQELQLREHGSYKQIVVPWAQEVAGDLSSGSFYLGLLGYPFPLLLVGLYAGRRHVLQDVSEHLAFIRKVFWWGLTLGLIGSGAGTAVHKYRGIYQAPWDKSWIGNAAFFQVGVPALCFSYAAAIVLLAQRPAWRRWLGGLAPIGRMALTNYILQVVIFDLLEHGFGLFGRFGPLLGIPIGLAVFVMQALLSTWWMRRFRFGPLEWLWRTLTYGKLQPMRVPRPAVTVTA